MMDIFEEHMNECKLVLNVPTGELVVLAKLKDSRQYAEVGRIKLDTTVVDEHNKQPDFRAMLREAGFAEKDIPQEVNT